MDTIADIEIINHVNEWVKYVSTTKTSNDWLICPHAAKVLNGDRLKIISYVEEKIPEIVENFLSDRKNFKVWVLHCPNADLKQICNDLNEKYKDIVFLYDFADASGYIDNTPTGNRKYDVILMQEKEELNKLSTVLQKMGYYSNWSDDYYNEIVKSRLPQ